MRFYILTILKEPFISTKVIVKVTHVFTYEIARRHDLWVYLADKYAISYI